MEVKTKLNLAQDAWFMRENIVKKDKVTAIYVRVVIGHPPEIDYSIGKFSNLPESAVFKTKEDLLKSL